MPVPTGSTNVQDHSRLPYMVVQVGKWWGLFQVPSTAPSKEETRQGIQEPEVVSWHATENDAEIAASKLALHDPSGRYGPVSVAERRGKVVFGPRGGIKGD